MPLKTALRRTPLIAVAGALVITGFTAGPAPAAAPQGADGVRSVVAFGATGVSAQKARTSRTRTCGSTSEPSALTVTDTRGKARGQMTGAATQSEKPNPKSRNWKRQAEQQGRNPARPVLREQPDHGR